MSNTFNYKLIDEYEHFIEMQFTHAQSCRDSICQLKLQKERLYNSRTNGDSEIKQELDIIEKLISATEKSGLLNLLTMDLYTCLIELNSTHNPTLQKIAIKRSFACTYEAIKMINKVFMPICKEYDSDKNFDDIRTISKLLHQQMERNEFSLIRNKIANHFDISFKTQMELYEKCQYQIAIDNLHRLSDMIDGIQKNLDQIIHSIKSVQS